MKPQRVVILGCAGTGKTSFSRKLAAHIGAPHVCMDSIWRHGWGPDDLPAFRTLIAEAHAGGAWVSDGNFAAATFDLRLPRADLVLWLERPRWLCAANAIRRLLEPDQAHHWRRLPHVLRFIARFDRVNRPQIKQALVTHAPNLQIRWLRTQAEEQALLTELSN